MLEEKKDEDIILKAIEREKDIQIILKIIVNIPNSIAQGIIKEQLKLKKI